MNVRYDQRNFSVRHMRQRARVALYCAALVGLTITALPQNGIAQQAGINPAVIPPIISAKPTEIENATNIKAQPLALLAKFPEAGPAMARYVAQQLTQQPGMVNAMLSIVSDTSPAQASAIGAGMVRAVRALSVKQTAAARSISEKVMRTDNKWLTTTFASLGPYYRGNAVFVVPPNLPPRESTATGEMGLGIGGAWRVGPAENESFTDRDPNKNTNGVAQKCLYDTNGNLDSHCRGMIVALIKSDASHNGAVSTSPTI